MNVRNSIVHNLKQQFGQTNHSEFSGTHESDSKKFRRISDKSEDNQRFFKNLVDLPNNSNAVSAIKPHSNNEISKSDVGSRGTTGKNIQASLNGNHSLNQGMNSIQMANAYCQDGPQIDQTSQGNSYNSRAALKSQINSANGHANNTASKQSLKNVQASSQLMNSSENTISAKTQDLKQGQTFAGRQRMSQSSQKQQQRPMVNNMIGGTNQVLPALSVPSNTSNQVSNTQPLSDTKLKLTHP